MLLNPKRSATLHFRVSILSPLRHQSTLPPNPNPTTPLTKSQLKALVINRYSRGKFSDLIQNVVASPPVLLLACQNLTSRSNDVNSPAVASRFSVKELGRELGENRFDVESCSVRMVPSRKKGLSSLQKMTAAIRMLAYGAAEDAVDDYVRIGESTTIESLKRFVRAVVAICTRKQA